MGLLLHDPGGDREVDLEVPKGIEVIEAWHHLLGDI
jgi:hypothetical protein